MNDRVILSTVPVCLFILALAGCASAKIDVDPDSITDAESLVDYLQENNVLLLDHGPVISQVLSVPGREYTPTSGGFLRVFKYPTEADALADLTRLERGRALRRSQQLYRKQDLVVLYEGDDPRMERALVRVFGSRIA